MWKVSLIFSSCSYESLKVQFSPEISGKFHAKSAHFTGNSNTLWVKFGWNGQTSGEILGENCTSKLSYVLYHQEWWVPSIKNCLRSFSATFQHFPPVTRNDQNFVHSVSHDSGTSAHPYPYQITCCLYKRPEFLKHVICALDSLVSKNQSPGYNSSSLDD